MRPSDRGFTWWVFASGLAFVLALALVPALAFTPEELLGERHIPEPQCKDGVCTIAEDDLKFIVARGRLMEELANRLYQRVTACRGERGV